MVIEARFSALPVNNKPFSLDELYIPTLYPMTPALLR